MSSKQKKGKYGRLRTLERVKNECTRTKITTKSRLVTKTKEQYQYLRKATDFNKQLMKP